MKILRVKKVFCCQVVLLLAITKVDSILFDKNYKHQQVKLRTTILHYTNNTLMKLSYPRKWQWKLGKIQKRQFDLVNAIWRKVRLSQTTTMATIKNRKRKSHGLNVKPYVFLHNNSSAIQSLPVITTTQSLMEFYYFNRNYGNFKLKPSKMRTVFFLHQREDLSKRNLLYNTSTISRKVKSQNQKPPSLKLPRSIAGLNRFRLVSPMKVDDEPRKQNKINVTVDNSQGLFKASGQLHPFKFNYRISVKSLNRSTRAKNRFSISEHYLMRSNAEAVPLEEKSEQIKIDGTRIKVNKDTYPYAQSKIKNDATKNSSANIDIWEHFSFIAVYVYEPLHVYCDAAILSEHWLVTAGSCLYRHRKEPFDAVSAFVNYCDKNWRESEQLNYVKYSVVHPHYHPNNVTRKFLYNIGLIQVVHAMSAFCKNWSTVSLMSRHFTTDLSGSPACAVGWGLDQYNNETIILAPSYLGIYNGIVYSHECPGNQEFVKFKSFVRDGSSVPVFCLLLPPYKGEQTDPIHGSLLLVDHKLIGIYLQEERRPSGPQSALYTSIWGLSPWVMNIAREPA